MTKNGTVVKSTDVKNTDSAGREYYYEYDKFNRLISETVKVGDKEKTTTTEYSYATVNINDGVEEKEVKNTYAIILRNEEGKEISATYTNNIGQVVKELKDGIRYDYTYDKSGNLYVTYVNGTSLGKDDKCEVSVSVYDKNGKLTDTILNPGYDESLGCYTVTDNSLVSTNKYDKSGNLKETISPAGRSVKYEYDDQGRVTKVNVVESDNDTSTDMTYKYDIENISDGKLVSTSEKSTDALGRYSETVSNGAGQVLEIVDETDSGTNKTTYEYDERGNLTKETYQDGTYKTYTYDDLGYVKNETTHNKGGYPQEIIVFTYDDDYNLVKTSTVYEFKNVCYSYNKYDEFGRVIGTASIYAGKEPSAEEIEKAMLIYEYNINDDVVAMYYPNNGEDAVKGVYYQYNEFNWITDIYAIMDNDKKNLVRHYEYASDGKVQEMYDYNDFINGSDTYVKRQYEYDIFNRVTSMKYSYSEVPNVYLEQYDYEYDKDSNITKEQVINLYTGNVRNITRTYEYDRLDRLVKSTEVNNLTGEETISAYEYDRVSNRIKKTVNGVETAYTYNKSDQLVKSVESDGANSYTTTYEYDARGNQTKVVDGKTNTTTEYKYDINCQLRDVTITKEGEETKTQQNVYNDEGQRISKTENGVKTSYYYEGSNVIYTTDADGNKTSLNIYGLDENVIATIHYEDDGQHAYTYSKDIQGSTYAIVDESGYFVVGYEYEDFGETKKIGDSAFYNEICYTGAIYDELTGLHYLNARYYNPDEAIFLSQDTYRGDKTDFATWNLYGYCAGNPIKYVDPSGHYVETLYDAYSFSESVVKFCYEPNLENAGWLVLDGIALIAPTPAPGKAGRLADDALEAVQNANKADTALDVAQTGKKVTSSTKVVKKYKSVKAKKKLRASSKSSKVKKAGRNKKAKKSSALTPDYVKNKRVPQDKETVLCGKEFKKTGKKVKGALVYKKGRHLGEANPITGKIKEGTADITKRINVK